MNNFDSTLTQISRNFNSLDSSVLELCNLLGLQVYSENIVIKEFEGKNKWENSQFLQSIIFKHQEIIKVFEKEESILKNIGKAVS